MDNQISNNAEMKAKIKSYFTYTREDKFTKLKVVKGRKTLEWRNHKDWSPFRNNFMPTQDFNLSWHSLDLDIEYRSKDEIDAVFFIFTYQNLSDGYPNMKNLKLFLIIDDNKTIELNDVSGLSSANNTLYIETGQLSISVSDFIQIANASKVEYSIRFGMGKLNGTFSDDQLNILKGFYNATFDEDFEVDRLYNYINVRDKLLQSKEYTSIQEINDAIKRGDLDASDGLAKINALNKKSGGCYIATMAYGSYEHPQVMILRNFRDNYLAHRHWGEKFITTYYKVSPNMVKHLKNKVLINKIIRYILDLFIKTIK